MNPPTNQIDINSLRQVLSNLPSVFSIDLETSGLDNRAEIITAALAWRCSDSNEVKSVALHLDQYSANFKQETETILREILSATLFNRKFSGQIIFHNAAFDLPLLIQRFGRTDTRSRINSTNYPFLLRDFCKVYDTQALSRVLRNNKFVSHADPRMEKCHSLKYLAREYLGIDHKGFVESVGQGNIRLAPIDTVLEYNRKDSELTLALFFHLGKQAKAVPAQWEYFEKVEMPFVMAIIGLNWRGLPFNHKRAIVYANLIKHSLFRLESEIFAKVGWSFNLRASADLGGALFNNSNLTYVDGDRQTRLIPPNVSETGLLKVDLETLEKLRNQISAADPFSQSTWRLLNQVIQFLELAQAYEDIEKLQRHSRLLKYGNYRIFSNITVDAKTGRIKCGSPNLLGIAKKIFTISILSDSDTDLNSIKVDFRSVRTLVSVDNPLIEEILSNDISGLDLGVITAWLLAHDPETYWKQCFERFGEGKTLTLDTHMAILRRVSPAQYQVALQAFAEHLGISKDDTSDLLEYWVTKKQNISEVEAPQDGFRFIHSKSGVITSVGVDKVSKHDLKAMQNLRSAMKTTNLAIPYNLGVIQLAKKLTAAIGRPVGEFEAGELLANYHKTFPEVRKFQDAIAEAVYRDGFLQSAFGRVIYADIFDEINAHLKNQLANKAGDTYEFLIFANDKYWYVKAEKWIKSPVPIVENLKLKPGASVLAFDKIHCIYHLDRNIFRKKKKVDHSRFSRKSEINLQDQSIYEANAFELTYEVDRALRFGTSWEPDAEALRDSWQRDGNYVIPEAGVAFYRVMLQNPSSNFFRAYKSLLKASKPFFATFCQAEATIVAKMCMNEIQKAFEDQELTAVILFFIYDQFDILALKKDRNVIREILSRAIESAKEALLPEPSQYPIRFFGEFEIKGEFFR